MKNLLSVLVFILVLATQADAVTVFRRADAAYKTSVGGSVLVSSNAQIWVYSAGTTSTVTIYSDSAGTTVLAQPVLADNYGNYEYYAPAGAYDEDIVGPVGTNPVDRPGIVLGITTSNFPFTDISVSGTASITRIGTAFFASRYASLTAAHTAAAEVTGGVVILDSTTTQLSSSGTLTTSVPVIWQGGKINKTASDKIYFGSTFEAPAEEVLVGFSAGDVKFAAGSIAKISPLWFSAVGDGVTDSTTAILSAIASAPSTGMTIEFPAGSFLFSSRITINKANMKFVGQGCSIISGSSGATTLLKKSTLNDVGIYISAYSVDLSDMTILGQVGNGGDGIQVGAGRARLRNIASYAMGNDGIRIGDGTANVNLWSAQNIYTKGNTGHGFHVEHDTAAAPDANAGTLINLDSQANIKSGLYIKNAQVNSIYNPITQTNGEYGLCFDTGAKYNSVFGSDIVENNAIQDLYFASGSVENLVVTAGLPFTGYDDAGLNNMIISPVALRAANNLGIYANVKFHYEQTDETTKNSRLYGGHYDNDEEPSIILLNSSTSTENQLILGGGSSSGNAATLIGFMTGATNTTTTGTERLRINNAGNMGLGQTSFGASGEKVFAIGAGVVPNSSPADAAQIYVRDINGNPGQAGVHIRNENTGNLIVVGAVFKTDTGDPTYSHEGLFCINTFDNTVKMYADGGWRTIASGW